MLYPFSYATEMGRQFLENSLLWVCLMAVVLFFFLLLKVCQATFVKHDKSTEQR
jgi:hypothetical protein